ncbi:MAG: type II secretion system protein GspK [Myxococcota bacterium]
MARLKGFSRQRGTALLMVLLLIALLGSVVAEFQYSSQIDLQLAVNARDELQAEYNALSALQVRAMLLRNAQTLQRSVGQLAGALGMGPEAMPSISQILEMIPVECGLLSAMTRTSESKSRHLDNDAAEEDDFFVGECIATSQSEHSKIPLRVLLSVRPEARDRIVAMLASLLVDPSLERHFQEDDLNGQHAESPQELIGAIADWMDRDEEQFFNKVSDEGRAYANLRDSYMPKNAPMDSVAELQLVYGVDDELYKILANRVSIYNESEQLELGTSPIENIIGMLGVAAREGVQFSRDDPMVARSMAEIYAALMELQGGGGGFAPGINLGLLRELTQQFAAGVIDPAQLGRFFTDRTDTTWYTIDAQGRVGNASRRIRAVFQAREGRFYHVRVE